MLNSATLLRSVIHLMGVCTILIFAQYTMAGDKPRIAIIIDDLGYHHARGLRAVYLQAPVSLAILPHAPNSQKLAKAAHSYGKEILLHTPMSTTTGKALDAGALTSAMGQAEFLQVLQQGLAAMPYASGINNHMGSLLTQQADPMHWLMAELFQKKLFFVDSRTTANSLAFDIAQDYTLPSIQRDIFLDNQRQPSAIAKKFDQLLLLAKKRGWAVAIGHPYPETLALLEQRLPLLTEQGYEVVPVSALLQTRTHTAMDKRSNSPTNGYINP